MRYVCRGEIHFARSHQTPISQANIVAPSTLGRDKSRPYIHDATHHGGGVREDADLLVTPYTARCAGYESKTKMVSAKDTDFLPSA
jgi:hypothetical protein